MKAKTKEDSLDDLLQDAADELAKNDCPTLAAAVQMARRHLATAPESGVRLSELSLSVADPDSDFDEDPSTGHLKLALGGSNA